MGYFTINLNILTDNENHGLGFLLHNKNRIRTEKPKVVYNTNV